MPYPTFPTVTPQVTDFEYAGDVDALGGTQLTMLLEGFMQQSPPTLEELFPTQYIGSRTITFEQYIDAIGIAPIVQMGVPSSTQLSNTRRVRKRFANPVFSREDIYVEDSAVNDLRAAGTYNDRVDPAAFIAKKVEAAYARRSNLITYLRYSALLGGIKYTDARSDMSIDVNTGIPKHNFFRYDGWDATIAATTAIPGTLDGNSYTAFKNMTGAKGRKEALLFTDVQNRVGVPWTNKQADVAASIRRLKNWLSEANRIDGWEIYMGAALYNALHENELIKAGAGYVGIIGNYSLTADGGRNVIESVDRGALNAYTFAGSDLAAISGCKVNVVRGRYVDPETGVATLYWPSHKIVMVCPRSMQNSNDTVGMTWHCMGEYSETIGPWIRSVINPPPPALPGTSIQTGDAFLPVVKYPHWLAVIDVCEPDQLTTGLFNDAVFDTGLIYNLY
jgi:hypothetical protein